MTTGVTIDFNANLARFSSSLDKATNELGKFQSNAQRRAKQMQGIFVGLGAAIPVAAIVAATKHSVDYADAIADASEKTGFSVQRLQELRFQADQTGVSFGELEGGLARFTKRLGLARMGTGAAAKTYEKLGIDLTRTNDQVFKQVIETLGSMEDETNRMALTTRIFGDDAQRLGVMFAGGNKEMQLFADKAHHLGLVLSDDLVQGASDANDQLAIMRQVINIQTVKIFNELAPVITQVGQAFANAAPAVADFFSSFGDVGYMTKSAAEEAAKEAQEAYDQWQEKLARRQEINADPSKSRRFSDLFLPSESEIKENLVYYEERFKTAISRIREINSNLGSASVKQIQAADISSLFDEASGAKGKLTEAQKALNDLMKEGARLTESLLTPSEAYQAELEHLNRLLDAGAISWETYHRGVAKAQDTFDQASGKVDLFKQLQQVINEVDPVAPLLKQLDLLEDLENKYPQYAEIIGQAMINVHDEIDKVNEGLEEQTEKAKEMADELGLSFSSAFEDAIVNGENLSEVLKGLEQDIIRIITRRLVTEPLSNAVSGFAMDFLPNLFGGGRAMGGSVFPGRLYQVNEQGPELLSVGNRDYLMMGNQGGYVTPNNRLGGGGTVNVYVQVPHNANPEAYRLSARQGALEGSRLLQAGGGIS